MPDHGRSPWKPSSITSTDEAAALLVKANKGMLTDPAFIRASMKALVEGNYLARPDGIVGKIDRSKI